MMGMVVTLTTTWLRVKRLWDDAVVLCQQNYEVYLTNASLHQALSLSLETSLFFS